MAEHRHVVPCNPFPPAPGIHRAVMRYTQDGQQLRSVLHFRKLDNTNEDIAAVSLSRSLQIWHADHQRARMSDACILTGIEVTPLGPEKLAPYLRSITSGGAGTQVGPMMPNAVALAMSWKTARRGRSFRGRTYHMGLTEQQCVGNQVASAEVTALVTAYNNLRQIGGSTVGEVALTTWQLVILSYYENYVCRGTPLATDVTSVATDGYIDIQRRRQPGRGN